MGYYSATKGNEIPTHTQRNGSQNEEARRKRSACCATSFAYNSRVCKVGHSDRRQMGACLWTGLVGVGHGLQRDVWTLWAVRKVCYLGRGYGFAGGGARVNSHPLVNFKHIRSL